MKTLKLKKLMLSVAIAIAAGVFLFAGEAFAANYYVEPSSYDYGTTETTHDFILYRLWGMGIVAATGYPIWVDVHPYCGVDIQNAPITFEICIRDYFRAWLLSNYGPGTYEATIDFRSGGSPVNHFYVDISVTILAPADISVSPGSHDFGASGTSRQFTVQNTGQEMLNWSVTDDAAWLSIDTTSGNLSGGASQNITASVSRSGLEGDYNGTISFTGGGGQNVSVSMKAFAIKGYIKEDGADGTGINGVTVTVKDSGDNVVGTDTTHNNGTADGWYEVKGLKSDTYKVTPSFEDYSFSPISPYSVSVTNNSRDDIHFYTYDISGYVKRYGTNVGENRIDVRITGGDRDIDITVQTHDRDGDPLDPGYYKLEHIGGGTYTIEATNP